MGTQEDRDWLDVANDLLSKCFINLRLKNVTDCDGDVFVALYEAILGEKVPDYIAAPKTQEDDVHNVQSVIDSLALDYLQISLSHITGENIVRGDKESIKNLLEIFDGLLEYLTEQISEDDLPHEDGVPHKQVTPAPKPTKELTLELEKLENLSLSSIHSSKHSPPSWSADGSESTAELIRLGDSAQTFVAKRQGRMNGFHQPNTSSSKLLESSSHFRKQADNTNVPVEPVCADPAHTGASLQKEPLCAAIPLQPPYQTTPQRLDRPCHSGTQSPASVPSQRGGQQEDMPLPLAAHACSQNSQSSRPLSNSIPANGIQSPHHPLEQSEMCASIKRGAKLGTEKEAAEVCGTRSRRVVFRTQPDVHVPTLRGRSSDSSLEESEEDDKSSSSSRRCCRHCRGRSVRSALCERHTRVHEGLEEPLPQRTQRNRLAEQELHHMSEKLAHRLEELDQMLKRALGESVDVSGSREEDKQSHHSDSCMEFSRTQTHTDSVGMSPAPKSPRTRSLSPSPPSVRRSLEPQLEAALVRDAQKHMAQMGQEELQELENQRRLGRLVSKSYEQELRGFEEKERHDIEKARRQAQEAEREYRETIWKDIAGTPKPFHASKVGQQHRTPRPRHVVHGRGRALPRKATQIKVKDNNLLPVLLEEFPHLQPSPHGLTSMWKQQLKQVDRLTAQSEPRKHIKLANQVAEAQKRHDLLVGIIRREQEHNQRLRDFRERIQQQRSAQNKVREQRQQVARARKYHDDYHVQLRARLMRARTREERMFRRAFEEGLQLQKEQLREQQAYAREQRQEHQRRHRDELQSMENYYRDQFSLLAEALAQERHEIQVRKKAQEKVLQKMKRDLRSKMEREIRELQKIIIQNDDDDFFWELDLERLQKRVRMASFQYHNGHHT